MQICRKGCSSLAATQEVVHTLGRMLASGAGSEGSPLAAELEALVKSFFAVSLCCRGNTALFYQRNTRLGQVPESLTCTLHQVVGSAQLAVCL